MLRTIEEVWTPEVRAAVADCYERTADPETRARCQILLLAGEQSLSVREIAPVVRRAKATVNWVLRRFIEAGLPGLPRRSAPGPAPSVALAWVIDQDLHDLGVPSANWTMALLAAYLARQTGIAVDQETVRRYLHRLGYVCKRPTWTLAHKAA